MPNLNGPLAETPMERFQREQDAEAARRVEHQMGCAWGVGQRCSCGAVKVWRRERAVIRDAAYGDLGL